jgi:hypothetical protein
MGRRWGGSRVRRGGDGGKEGEEGDYPAVREQL